MPKKELLGEGGSAYAVNGPGPLEWKAGGHVRGSCLMMKEKTKLPGARVLPTVLPGRPYFECARPKCCELRVAYTADSAGQLAQSAGMASIAAAVHTAAAVRTGCAVAIFINVVKIS